VRELESAGRRSSALAIGEDGEDDDVGDLEGGGGWSARGAIGSSSGTSGGSGGNGGSSGTSGGSGGSGEGSGWVQRPCPRRGLGCGGASERAPLLLVGNKEDLGVAFPNRSGDQRDERLPHASRISSWTGGTGCMLLSATDPHLDTKGLHDFFQAARDFKQGGGHRNVYTSAIAASARLAPVANKGPGDFGDGGGIGRDAQRHEAVLRPLRSRAGTDPGLPPAGELTAAMSADVGLGVHRVGSWGAGKALPRGPKNHPSERRHSGPHTSSSSSSSSGDPSSGGPAPEASATASALRPPPGSPTGLRKTPAASPLLKEKEGKLM
jgi:hypothetical protein